MKKHALCSPELYPETRKIFNSHGIFCIDIPAYKKLQKPVYTHPDMLFFKLSDGSYLTEKDYYEENRAFFASLPPSLKIKTSSAKLSENYPCDVAFDALKVENTLFCLKKHTCPEIIADSAKVINVKQGYAKCSSLVIGSSVITADKSIYSAVTENSFDCLLISPDGIQLNGYGCGFIGGASAVLEDEKTVIFFGNISLHTSFNEIQGFCQKKGYKLLFECNSYPSDFGGALLFSV